MESLDRCDETRILIQKEGLVKTTAATGALHLHPAARIEIESRAQFTKLWTALGAFETAIGLSSME